MKILFLHTAPPPKIKNTDAVFNEISLIKDKVEFEDIYLLPLKTPTSLYPRFLYGLHNISEIIEKESTVDICHIFSPFLYFFPILNFLKKPIIYSALSSDRSSVNNAKCRALARIIVSNRRSAHYLETRGLNNVTIIKPGIKFDRTHTKIKDTYVNDGPLKIILASAPWTKSQIKSKGIVSLLRVAKSENIHLTIVLRGHFEKEIKKLIGDYNAGANVKIINEEINVPVLMQKHHAVVLLSEESAIVKSYPHSLIEGLSVGVPVIVSDTIAIADTVQENGLGVVVDGIEQQSLLAALRSLRTQYEEHVENISKFDLSIFSPQKFVDSTMKIYEQVLSERK